MTKNLPVSCQVKDGDLKKFNIQSNALHKRFYHNANENMFKVSLLAVPFFYIYGTILHTG